MNISDYLYSLRDEAGIAAERLKKHIAEAQAVYDKLDAIADGAQDAAELVAASDLEPNAVSTIPEASGLTRIEKESA